MSELVPDLPQLCRELKIVLINPLHAEWGHTPPLGIAYIAAVLEESSLHVDVIDMCAYGMGLAELGRELTRCGVDVVGVTATTPQVPIAWDIAELAKGINPACKVVLGGVHPTSLPDESLSKPHVDFVVRGEGEVTMLELIRALGSSDDLESIKGLSFIRDGEHIHNPARPLMENLDDMPFPARHLFPFPEAYKSPMLKRKLFADIFTSRGCRGTCIFCNHTIFGHTFRARTPENVLSEIEFLKERYGVEELHIADDSFSYDAGRAMRICDLIIEGDLDIAWSCSGGIRVDCITRELLERMKQAGCYRIHYGVESGSDEILRKIGKGITRQQVRQAFDMARDVGLTTVALFMLGNYGETRETMQATIDFAKSLNTDFAQFTMAVPLPGTPFFKLLDKGGNILTRDWRQYEFFEEPIFETEDLTRDLIIEMFRKAHREYYFRPGYVLGRVRRIRSLGDIGTALAGLREIMRRATVEA